jgi:hypothetical protein
MMIYYGFWQEVSHRGTCVALDARTRAGADGCGCDWAKFLMAIGWGDTQLVMDSIAV